MKQPSNETFLAAELAATRKAPSARCASVAHEACKLGRRYFKLSESLCCWPDPNEARSKRRRKIRDKIDAILSPFGCSVEHDGGGLGLICTTKQPRGYDVSTVLR